MRRRLFTYGVVGLLLGSCKDAQHPTASSRPRVQAKSGQVWARDLSLGLGLESWELCKELGSYDCVRDAHNITLGGVEPTELGIDRPLSSASVSAPMAVERVAVAACGERLARDEEGSAVLFGPFLEDNSPTTRRRVATSVVQRLLGRHPTETELSGLVDLYDTISKVSNDPKREWAVGVCVVVATSTEALFY